MVICRGGNSDSEVNDSILKRFLCIFPCVIFKKFTTQRLLLARHLTTTTAQHDNNSQTTDSTLLDLVTKLRLVVVLIDIKYLKESVITDDLGY